MMHHMILLLHYLSTSGSTTAFGSLFPSTTSIVTATATRRPMLPRHPTIDHQEEHDSYSHSHHPHHHDDDNDIRQQDPNHLSRNNIDPWLFTGAPISLLMDGNDDDDNEDEETRNTMVQLPPPVVGVLAQPYYDHHHISTTNSSSTRVEPLPEQQYIAASYIKWIESGGGRSIYIPYDTTDDSLLDIIYHQINGLLLPGGNNSTLPYAVSYLLQKAMTSHSNGIYFPVWGTCLGFEMIVQFIGDIWNTTTNHYPSSDTPVTTILQDGFNSSNISLPLIVLDGNYYDDEDIDPDQLQQLRQPTSHSGTALRSTTTITTKQSIKTTGTVKGHLYKPKKIYHSVTKYPITMNNHHQGIEPNQFLQNKNLVSLFDITSINYDLNHRPFVSTIEPKDPYQHPIYGVQYHPEKNPFEYSTYPNTTIPFEAIDHSMIGIDVSFYLSKFFMNCVRYNQYHFQQYHKYTDPIAFPLTNTYPIISGGLSFEEVYIFPNASHYEKSMDLY